MAKKNESPSTDPAELAFSAVENALRDSVFSLDRADEENEKKTSSKAVDSKPATPERAHVAQKIAERAAIPANDDRYTSSKLLQSMQSRPSSAPLWIAVFVSLAWIVATGFVGWLRFGDQISRPEQWNVFVTTADFAGLLAITTLPILGFFAVAVLARRAQDLRIAATSMTQAAIRLAEPETTAADKVASVGQAVRREVNALGDGLERALSRAGELEVMVHNEVTSLERTYSDNEMRLRSLIQELAAQRESVITNSDRVREAIVEAHNMMVDDIDKAGLKLSETIIERGSEVKTSVDLVTENLNTAFGSRSEEFISLIDQRSTNLLSAIDESADRLNATYDDRATLVEKTFDQRSDRLATVLEERMNILTEELDSRAISVSQSIDEKTSALASALQEGGSVMISDLESRGYAMNGALEAIGSRLVNDIEERASKTESTMGGIADRLDENMSIHLNSLDSRLHTAVLEIGGAMDETTEKASKAITEAGVGTLQQLDTRVEEVALVIDSRLQEVDAIVGDKGEKLIEALTNHTHHFSTSSNLLETALTEKTDKLETVIKAQAERLESGISGHTNRFAETIDASANTLSAAFDGQIDKFTTKIDTSGQQLSETLTERTREFAEKLGTRSQQLSDAMGTRTNEFGEILNDRTQKLSDILEKRTTEFGSTLETRTDALSQALETSTNALNEEISGHTDKIASTVESQSTVVQARVDDAMRNVTETMEGRANHVSAIISSKIAEVNESIGMEVDEAVRRLSDAESGVTARIDSAAGNIAESAQHAAQLIEGGMDAARHSITDMVDQRLGTLPEAITARADITADRLSSLNESISASIGKSMTDLEKSADQIEETIGSRIASASMTIANDVEQSTARMDVAVRTALEQVREATRHIEDLVEVKALDTANTLGAKVEEMNQTLTSYSNNFSNLIDDRSQALENSLKGHGNILRSALEESTSVAEDLMSASSSRILTDVNEALKKLNDSNLLLQRVLETSTTNLADLENSVAGHTRSYANTVKDAVASTEQAGELVSQHVTALQTTIHSMVGEFGSLLGSLDSEAVNINNAAESLSSAGNLTIDTLENRRDAMEALVMSFTARADDVDERMRTFAQSIANTVNDTERRLLAARRAMEEALDSTAQTVTERLDTITQTAGVQGQQAGDHVRHIQQTLINEIQSAFDEATSRFDQTANAMRTTAQQVGSELEATRSELQRGVVELPEETRASAAAMRRVVAEQIEALNELNNIVRTQPGTHDVSSRRRAAPAPSQQREIAPRLREPQPRQEVARQEPVRQEPAHREPPRQVPQQPRHNDGGDVASLLRSQPQAAQAARQQPPVAQRQVEAPNRGVPTMDRDEEDGSWLRDVLRNATAKQQAESGNNQRGVSLSNLTDEVTRAMDENALIDAWQRYRAGEINVFSRRIYTLTGQGTYDEVRKKIQRDADFAKTAAAYMDEFEQLLSATASDPRAAVTMQEQLISDRGKVYTMLAHASGRLS